MFTGQYTLAMQAPSFDATEAYAELRECATDRICSWISVYKCPTTRYGRGITSMRSCSTTRHLCRDSSSNLLKPTTALALPLSWHQTHGVKHGSLFPDLRFAAISHVSQSHTLIFVATTSAVVREAGIKSCLANAKTGFLTAAIGPPAKRS